MTCRENSNCKSDELCSVSSLGLGKCEAICGEKKLCGRNAHCEAKDHVGKCECNQGFTKDVSGDCIRIECLKNSDCPDSSACIDSKCQLGCKLPNICPPNSICTSTAHEQKCSCKPGYFSSNSSKDGET